MRTMKEQTELLDKLLGGGIDTEILLFALERARELILNYCRLKELPAGLENTLLSLCVDIYRAEQPGRAQTVGAVKSITEGDVSVAFDTTDCVSLSHSDILKNYKICDIIIMI